mgnify:CR=1 FL=1
MTHERFAQAVRHHFTHPPHTWTVTRRAARRWAVIDGNGAIVESTATRAAAEDACRRGVHARLWHAQTAWYLGCSTDPRYRALSVAELRTVADILTALDHPGAPAARRRGWPDAEFCDLCDLVLTGPDDSARAATTARTPDAPPASRTARASTAIAASAPTAATPSTADPHHPGGAVVADSPVAPAPPQPPGADALAHPTAGPRSAHIRAAAPAETCCR